jgi:hypothetical protein
MHNIPCHRVTEHLQLNIMLLSLSSSPSSSSDELYCCFLQSMGTAHGICHNATLYVRRRPVSAFSTESCHSDHRAAAVPELATTEPLVVLMFWVSSVRYQVAAAVPEVATTVPLEVLMFWVSSVRYQVAAAVPEVATTVPLEVLMLWVSLVRYQVAAAAVRWVRTFAIWCRKS